VEGHRRDFVLAVESRAVEGLDIGEYLIDDQSAGIDSAAGQAKKHERVVRIRAVGDGDSI
jgi:hypothetical protein